MRTARVLFVACNPDAAIFSDVLPVAITQVMSSDSSQGIALIKYLQLDGGGASEDAVDHILAEHRDADLIVLAAHRSCEVVNGDPQDLLTHTMDVLQEHGFEVAGIWIDDYEDRVQVVIPVGRQEMPAFVGQTFPISLN